MKLRTVTFLCLTVVLLCDAVSLFTHQSRRKDDPARVTEAGLYQAYALFNSGWFAGDLPEDTEIHLGDIPSGYAGYQSIMGLTDWDAQRKKFVIYISSKWNPGSSTADLTLIHEMCHVQTFNQEFDDHGPKWEQCMVNIAEHGGLHGIW